MLFSPQTCIYSWEAGPDPKNPNFGAINGIVQCDCNIKACGCKVEVAKQCQNQVSEKHAPFKIKKCFN